MEGVAIVAIEHQMPIDEALYMDLWDVNRVGFVTVDGHPIPEDRVVAEAKSKLRRMERVGLAFSIPLARRPAERKMPTVSFAFTRMKGLEVGGDGEEQEGAIVEFGVLARSARPYATITAREELRDDSRIVETTRQIAERLKASFVFGDSALEFCDPNPENPRQRAWGLTYYGPSLVSQLGRDRVASAPAWKVEFDDRGGAWVWLDELPLKESPEKAARRKAVEEHLRLAEVFPNVL